MEKLDPNISIPETWAEHSNRNIQESQSSITFFVTFLFTSKNLAFHIYYHQLYCIYTSLYQSLISILIFRVEFPISIGEFDSGGKNEVFTYLVEFPVYFDCATTAH